MLIHDMFACLCIHSKLLTRLVFRSFWIPESWYLRMVCTNGIPCRDPSQEFNGADQHQESRR